MDKNKKPFKPGQLVTIGNHIYRVVKNNPRICISNLIACNKCAFRNMVYITICERFCFKKYHLKDKLMPANCCFKFVK